MKLVKVFSLIASVSMCIMAFAVTSPAFANENSIVLCKNAELTCENPSPNPTTIVAHASSPKILSSIGTVECDKSLIEFTILNELGKLLLAHILSLSFEGKCHLGSTSCTVTVNDVGGLSFTHSGSSLVANVKMVAQWLIVFIEGQGEVVISMETSISIKCGFLISCTYSGEGANLAASSSWTGEVTLVANEAILKRGAGFCPEGSKWDATYTALSIGPFIES